MTEKVVGGLKWVKGEIATTLRRVRGLVEAYGQSSEPAALGDAVDALFEVRGVLLALQLTLPARLVDEMQRLCDAMADGRARSPKEATEAMLLALIQLPSHLDRLDAGAELPPLSLWPTINDLRASRGAPPLTPAELLVPGSVLAAEDEEVPEEALEALAVALRKVRPHFHRHLVDWYRATTSAEGLVKLSRLFQQLYRFLKDGILADLFRLAEVYMAGLQRGQVAADKAAQALVGRLDRVFKPLVTLPPQWPEAEIRDLIDEFLTELDQADVQPVLVAEIRAHYARPALDLPASEGAPEALAGLAEAMLGEMAILKECLDLFVRGERTDRTPLDALHAGMRNLARALEGADTGDLAQRLRVLADGFGNLALADAAADVARLQPLTAELLGIEARLQAYAQQRPRAPGLEAVEFAAARRREARAGLVEVKAAILDCQPPGARPTSFQELPERLVSVAAALAILGDERAAAAADAIAHLVRRRYVAADRWPRAGEFERLADAVAALELYIERCEEGQPQRDDLLGRIGASLAELERLLGQPPGGASGALPGAGAPGSTVAGAVPAAGRDAGRGPTGAGIAPEFLDIFLEEARAETDRIGEEFVRWGAHPGDEVALTNLRRSFHTLKGSGRLVGAARSADLAQVVEDILDRLIGHSLTPDASLMAWLAEVVDLVADLVSAEAHDRPLDIAELLRRAAAWGGSPVPASLPPAVFPAELPPPAVPAPALVLPAPPVAVEGLLIESVDHWFETQPRWSGPTAHEPRALPPQDGAAQRPGSVAHADDSDRIGRFVADAELLELFRTETAHYLDDLRAFLGRAAAGRAVPDEETVRALHTINGSAGMVGIDSIAAVAKSLEQRLRPLQSAARPASAELLDLIDRALAGIAARTAEVPAWGLGAATLTALATALAALPESNPVPKASRLPDSGFAERSVPAHAGAAQDRTPVADAGGVDLVLRDSDMANFFDWPPEPGPEGAAGPADETLAEPLAEPDRVPCADLLPASAPAPPPPVSPRRADEDSGGVTDELAAELAQALSALDGELESDERRRAGGGAPPPDLPPAATAVLSVDDLDWERVPLELSQWSAADEALDQARPRSGLDGLEPLPEERSAVAVGAPGVREPGVAGTPESFALIESVDELEPLPALWSAAEFRPPGAPEPGMTGVPDRAPESFSLVASGDELESLPALSGAPEPGMAGAPESFALVASDDELESLPALSGAPEPGMAGVSDRAPESFALSESDDESEPFPTLVAEPVPGVAPGSGVTTAPVAMPTPAPVTDLAAGSAVAPPADPAILPAFLVRVAGQVYAVPQAMVAGVARISRDDLVAIYAGRGEGFADHGQRYRVAYLGRLLDPGAAPDLDQRRWLPLLLTRADDLGVALQVDQLIASTRIRSKPLGPQLAALRGLAGATILPDGRVALILDVLALLRVAAVHQEEPGRRAPAPAR